MKTRNKIMSLLLIGSILIPTNVFAMSKQEVVFTTLSNTGKVESNIVNNYLKYIPKGDIEDETILKDILNISGDEKLTQSEGKILLKSEGKDITYQGKTDKELPLDVTIDYYLDGKKLPKKEILNKKGKVEIVISFNNKSYSEKYNLHTPFVVTLASVIKGDNKNMEVTNGKIVNTGTKNVLVSVAAPGLYSDLKLDELKGMDQIKISYETEKFVSSDLYIVATPKILGKADLRVFDKLSYLNSSVKQMQDGINSLSEGANQLVEGSFTLSEKLEEAFNGSKQITSGLEMINSNSNSISSLITLVDSLYSKYQENSNLLLQIENGSAKSQLENGIASATVSLNDLMGKKAAYEQLKSLKDSNIELPEDKLLLYNQLEGSINQITMGIEQYRQGIDNAQKQLAALPTNYAALQGSNATIETILKQLLKIDNMSQVPDAIQLFKQNIEKLTNGISSLKDGSNNLTNGLGGLSDGANTLHQGTEKLRDGINKFNSEGITKLTSVANLINNYSYKVDSLINLSRNYNGYSSNNSDEIVFIFKVNK